MKLPVCLSGQISGWCLTYGITWLCAWSTWIKKFWVILEQQDRVAHGGGGVFQKLIWRREKRGKNVCVGWGEVQGKCSWMDSSSLSFSSPFIKYLYPYVMHWEQEGTTGWLEIKCIIWLYFLNGILCCYSSPIPVAARSKALVCGCSLAGIECSNPAGNMNVSVFIVVCCQVEVSSSGWSLVQRSSTVCGVSECDREDQ